MLNIPKENIFEFNDISYREMKEFYEAFMMQILAISKTLVQLTGIGGKNLIQGLRWDRLKATAMKKGQPKDRVTVRYNFNL